MEYNIPPLVKLVLGLFEKKIRSHSFIHSFIHSFSQSVSQAGRQSEWPVSAAAAYPHF